MTTDNVAILVILAVTVALFLWGKVRYDMVALGALLACVFAGLVPADDAFVGFGNPAVVTVGAVLVLSYGLQSSGAVDMLAQAIMPKDKSLLAKVIVLLVLGALLSAVMNNVGAMALLMPLAIQMARQGDIPPGRVLMPLAFATILGGMVTLIGTPPNLIVSGYRDQALGGGYAMFDFTPVGGAVAVAGIAFLVLFGHRLIPNRKPAGDGAIRVYQTELVARSGSPVVKLTVSALEKKFDSSELKVKTIMRGPTTIDSPEADEPIEAGDRLLLSANLNLINEGVQQVGLEVPHDTDDEQPHESTAREVVVMPHSKIVKRTSKSLELKRKYGLSLLAISRNRSVHADNLNTAKIKAGDVLLLQGNGENITDFVGDSGCLSLSERDLNLPSARAPLIAGLVMIGAIILAASSLVSTAVAFALGALVITLAGVVPIRRFYDAVDWSVILLLACMLPVAAAMQTTGTADLIARFLLDHMANGNAIVALTIILVFTMFASDVMNNAATAAVMCPIALQAANSLDVNPDSFLMAVAIGASCAFLTPIGHQNNTLILGPSGFKFGDYWKLGLPLEILIVAISVPLLLLVWPL